MKNIREFLLSGELSLLKAIFLPLVSVICACLGIYVTGLIVKLVKYLGDTNELIALLASLAIIFFVLRYVLLWIVFFVAWPAKLTENSSNYLGIVLQYSYILWGVSAFFVWACWLA